jgi:threonyl-tRNA synthetase
LYLIAILLENTAGNLPIWLIPEQVAILSISDKYEKYTKKVLNLLENNEIRALVDDRSETMSRKIRDAEVKKIPFMIVVGEKEELENKISVRKHGGKDIGMMTVENYIKIVRQEIDLTLNKFNN